MFLNIPDTLLNETLETRITRPLSNFQDNVTLYHASPYELKVIEPMSNNIGTRLSDIRKSSFWMDNKKSVEKYMLSSMIPQRDNLLEVYNDKRNGVLNITKRAYNIAISLDKCFYIYEVTVPWSIVGRGHNVELNEYTLDRPIKPDKKTKYIIKNIIKKVKKNFITDEEARQAFDDIMIASRNKEIFPSGRGTDIFEVGDPTFMDRLIYYPSGEARERKRILRKELE